jgi:hypothetical protein
MDRQLREWKLSIDRLWSAAPDYRQAERLAVEISRASEDATLRQAASQALPNLRNASLKRADRSSKDLAWRRLGLIRDVLHVATAPRFGRRADASKLLTPEESYRQMLGLPFDRRLTGPEIHQAYKRAAKTMHPDGGGNEHKFHELCAARDALMKVR